MEEINTKDQVLCLHSQQDRPYRASLATLVVKHEMAQTESFQNRTPHIATGQLVLTPIEALRMNANVPNYTTTSNRNVLKAKEKSLQVSKPFKKNCFQLRST